MTPFLWIVPVMRRGKVLGNLNLSLEGSLMGQVSFQKSQNDIWSLSSVVTRMTAKEAIQEAQEIVGSYPEA